MQLCFYTKLPFSTLLTTAERLKGSHTISPHRNRSPRPRSIYPDNGSLRTHRHLHTERLPLFNGHMTAKGSFAPVLLPGLAKRQPPQCLKPLAESCLYRRQKKEVSQAAPQTTAAAVDCHLIRCHLIIPTENLPLLNAIALSSIPVRQTDRQTIASAVRTAAAVHPNNCDHSNHHAETVIGSHHHHTLCPPPPPPSSIVMKHAS